VAAPTRTAELKVVGIDISIEKEELRQALALSAECGVAEIQVEEIGASKGGLGAVYVKCSVAGTRKLAQAGKVALGWSTARVIAIPKRPLQCYKCLELGHVRATCVSTVERGHLCYRSGHRAIKCLASTPKCQPQDGRDGMHAAEDKEDNQEKNTLPRISHHGRNTGMLCRCRRRQRNNISSSSDEEEISHYYEDYREKRRALQQEIQIAKTRS
jgi:hypothetical protein